MNSLVLLVAATVAFGFGYRFYSKLLGLAVFRLEKDYSTPSSVRPAEGEHGTSNRHIVLGHHLASLAAGAAVTGCLVSLIWGWIPAFLWAVVGTVTAAGTYGLGAIWLSLRFPGLNPAEVAARILGPPAHGLFALLSFILLLIMNAACATFAAQLMSAFPSAVLPFWIIAGIALFLGNFLQGRDNFEVIAASLIALILALAAVWLLSDARLAFTGALNIETTEWYVSINATVVWVIVLFAYGYHATRLPMWKLIRPRAYLTALLLGMALFIFYTAVVIDHPDLVAPEFHTGPGIPDTLPWLFITLTSGAVAGFHLLIANGITARQMKHETDARYIGYGGALALGLLALSAIIIGGTAFSDIADWNRHYDSWDGLGDLSAVFEIYINGFARLVGGTGLDSSFARNLAAVVILGLLTATLEAGLRVQKHLLAGVSERYPSVIRGGEKFLIWIAVGSSAVLALHSGLGRGGLVLWPFFGVADLVLAVFGFALLALTLRRMDRPVTTVLLPLVFILVVANWALALQIRQWWLMDNWALLVLGIILILTELGIAFLTMKTLKSLPEPKLDTET